MKPRIRTTFRYASVAALTTCWPTAAPLFAAEPVQDKAISLLKRLNFQSLWLENSLGDWLVLLASIVIGLVLGRVAAAILRRIAGRLEARGWRGQALVFGGLASPASLALLTIGLTIGLANLTMSDAMQDFRAKTLLLLFAIAVFWYIYNLIGIVDLAIAQVTRHTESTLDRELAPLVRKTLRIFLIIVGLLFVVESVFNQDIGAWLAGLGIAGLAVSLAAQDSLKNLFGSITILLDKPFRVGERIVTSGCEGVVEEIGFRSTKVRTATGSLVNIPNANLVNNTVENIGRRPYICRNMSLAIPHDTQPPQINQALQILRDILAEAGIREPIGADTRGSDYRPRAYFSDIKPDQLLLSVTYWYSPPNYWDYIKHAERLNLRICEEFTKAGIDFAAPKPPQA